MKTKKGSKNKEIEKLELGFINHYGDSTGVKLFRSPSSIILLGDHTQYNDGIMISTAVDSFVYMAFRRVEENISIVFDDVKFEGTILKGFPDTSEDSQLNSLFHLINNLIKEDILGCGFECFIINKTSKVFGLGNHAALTMGFLRGLTSASCIELNNQQMVDAAVKSETELFGPVVSKPLFHSSLGQRVSTLLYYDNRSDFKKYLTIDDEIQIIICNTNHQKENFHERCKDRIMECEVGVKGLRLYIWGIKNLRDVEEKFLERHVHMLPKRLYSRCLYNVIQRKIVEEAYKNLRHREFDEFAGKLTLTHEKLSEVYEISSPTMDRLVKIADESKLSMGSKMVSCSYHDSTLNFVYKKNSEKFKNYFKKEYVQNNGTELEIECYTPAEGAKQLKLGTKSTVQ